MGKHTDHLNYLREQRRMKESHFQHSMAIYSSIMDDNAKRLNQQNHSFRMNYLDRQIQEAEQLAQQEQIDEITKDVLNNFSKEGSKAAKDIANELQRALKSIKL